MFRGPDGMRMVAMPCVVIAWVRPWSYPKVQVVQRFGLLLSLGGS